MVLPKRLYSSYTTFILPLQTCLEHAEQAHTELKVLEANGSSPQAVLLRGLAPHLGPSRQQNALPRHPTWAQTGCIQEQTSLGSNPIAVLERVRIGCKSMLPGASFWHAACSFNPRADSAGRTRLASLVCRGNLWRRSAFSGIATWSAT